MIRDELEKFCQSRQSYLSSLNTYVEPGLEWDFSFVDHDDGVMEQFNVCLSPKDPHLQVTLINRQPVKFEDDDWIWSVQINKKVVETAPNSRSECDFDTPVGCGLEALRMLKSWGLLQTAHK